MAIRAGFCNAAKLDFLLGRHRPDHDYRIALYRPNADIGPHTDAYTSDGEVNAPGYTAGGTPTRLRGEGLVDDVAWLDFDNVEWPNSSITARGALLYNASADNRAIAVLDFNENKISMNGPFVVEMPEPGRTALVRLL